MAILKHQILNAGRLLLLFLILIAIISGYLYFNYPVYNFNEPQPFKGGQIFNPYKDLDPVNWKKANFHCHTEQSDGKNSAKEVQHAYKKFGYEFLTISDHFTKTETDELFKDQVKSYEQGFNFGKYHILVFGDYRVSFLDIPFVLTLSHKIQNLKKLAPKSDMLVLAHPDLTLGLRENDMRYLSGYQMIEVPRGANREALIHYDAALSCGHYSSLVGGDDCHNVYSDYEFGRALTFVNVQKNNPNAVYHALLAGKTFAVTLPVFRSPELKLKRNLNLPMIRKLEVRNDSVRFQVTEPAVIKVFGQNGKLRHTTGLADHVMVHLKKDDSYLRFMAIFQDSVILYSNPVVKCKNQTPEIQHLASVNLTLTIFQSFIILSIEGILINIFFILFYHVFRIRKTVLIYKVRYYLPFSSLILLTNFFNYPGNVIKV